MVAHDHAVTGRRLLVALGLTAGMLVAEAVVGLLANSLALLSDAGHLLTDVVALALAWFANRLSSLPPDDRQTFGYRRSSILAALANAATLFVVTVVIVAEATIRLRTPVHVAGVPVLIAAASAVVINGYIAFQLHGVESANLNTRAALVHVLGDMAASFGVIVAAALILGWKLYLADPLVSYAIALLIAAGAWRIVRDTVAILMESTPRGVDLEAVRAGMLEVPGVEDVHDLHVWALSDGFHLLSAHVSVPDQSLSDTANLLYDLKLLLRRRYYIEHATIETECIDCRVPQPRPISLRQRS